MDANDELSARTAKLKILHNEEIQAAEYEESDEEPAKSRRDQIAHRQREAELNLDRDIKRMEAMKKLIAEAKEINIDANARKTRKQVEHERTKNYPKDDEEEDEEKDKKNKKKKREKSERDKNPKSTEKQDKQATDKSGTKTITDHEMATKYELLAETLAKLKVLHNEEIQAAENEDERESDLVAEFKEFLERKQMRKLAQQKEDVLFYINTEAEISGLELKEQQNERKRQETFKNLRLLDEREEGRRNDDLKNSLQILNRQRDRRQHQRLKEIMMETIARRDRIQDRQVEAERNYIRDKNRMAALQKLAMTMSEYKENVFDAQRRTIDKQIEYMEERRNNAEAIRNTDKNMLEYLDEWQQKGGNRSYDYELTPTRSEEDDD